MNELLAQGGWVIAAIGCCSVVACAVVLERLVALRRRRVIAPAVAAAAEAHGQDQDRLLLLCSGHPGPFSRIIAAMAESAHLDAAQRIEGMRAAGRIEVDRLERGLALLEIIAAVAPLLGLLGTVLGMMDVFSVISAEGLGDAQVLSEGISKALITTVAGLCVAMPALAFHSILTRRVSTLASEMQERATRFVLGAYGPERATGDAAR